MRYIKDWSRFRKPQERDPSISEGWELKKKKRGAEKVQHTDLVVVDVQDAFEQYFSDQYVEKLFDYCRTFQRVFQVWDDTEQSSASHEFPHQMRSVVKTYGFDLDESDYENYFMPDVAAKLRVDAAVGLRPGTMYAMRHGDYAVYVGNKHEWFQCPEDLSALFRGMAKAQRRVVLVGGAYGECLEDVYQTARAHGIDALINEEYTYSCLDKKR